MVYLYHAWSSFQLFIFNILNQFWIYFSYDEEEWKQINKRMSHWYAFSWSNRSCFIMNILIHKHFNLSCLSFVYHNTNSWATKIFVLHLARIIIKYSKTVRNFKMSCRIFFHPLKSITYVLISASMVNINNPGTG